MVLPEKTHEAVARVCNTQKIYDLLWTYKKLMYANSTEETCAYIINRISYIKEQAINGCVEK